MATDMTFIGAASAEDKAATRAVAGAGDEIRRRGGSERQADAVEVALKRFLLGDRPGARNALRHGFGEAEIDDIIFQFERGVMEGQTAAA